MRSVLSAAPVAIKVPEAFHDMVRMKCADDTDAPGRGLSMYTDVLSLEKAGEKAVLGSDRARVGGAMLAASGEQMREGLRWRWR
jgi:hypothetical protein